MTESITIAKPDDFHLHLRQDIMLLNVIQHCRNWGRVLVMPNLSPNPVLNGPDAMLYKAEILEALNAHGFYCEPLMTIQLTENTTPEMIFEAKRLGVIAAKAYPKAQTTNSDNGISDYHSMDLHYALNAMQECGMVLCLHGETPKPGVFCLDREKEFLEIVEDYAELYPNLKIVLEHITTEAAVDLVNALPENVAATITLHHLLLTLDDVVGNTIQPHYFCKPIAKREGDRQALLVAAMQGWNNKFFFGSDSAPHEKKNKECASGCAGIYTAPVALPLLAEVFETYAVPPMKDLLEAFVSKNGRDFYELPPNEGTITLVKEPWTVPYNTYDYVVPFYVGKEISWRIQ